MYTLVVEYDGDTLFYTYDFINECVDCINNVRNYLGHKTYISISIIKNNITGKNKPFNIFFAFYDKQIRSSYNKHCNIDSFYLNNKIPYEYFYKISEDVEFVILDEYLLK